MGTPKSMSRATKADGHLAAMNRLCEIAEPYARMNPRITMGEVLAAEATRVADAAGPQPIPKWERGSVMVRIKAGQVETAAMILGPLAVNPDRKKGLFCLTHRPTGLALMSGQNKRLLMDAAERIVHLDWGFTRHQDIPTATKADSWVVIQAVRFGVELPKVTRLKRVKSPAQSGESHPLETGNAMACSPR